MIFNSLNKSIILTLALSLPMVLLFQNCGSSSGYGNESSSDSDNAKLSSGSGGSSSGYQPVSTGGSGGTTGTFSFVNGGSSSGGSTSGGSSSGGSGSSGGSSSGGTSGSVPFDGKNCYRGNFGILKEVHDRFNSGSGNSIAIIRMTPFTDTRTLGGPAGVALDFLDDNYGETQSFSCTVSFSKLKKFFPAYYFTTQYTCAGNESNVTTFQCKDGHWIFAGSSCECKRIPFDFGSGRDR